MPLDLRRVDPDTLYFVLLIAAAEALDQARYITRFFTYASESVLIGAFIEGSCVGFLRLLMHDIGSDRDRSPIQVNGIPLREGFVEAFGVLPEWRRQGIGERLQNEAIQVCQERGCYQIRSHSPIIAVENYALKLKMGYAIHPDHQYDSYYFIKTLDSIEKASAE